MPADAVRNPIRRDRPRVSYPIRMVAVRRVVIGRATRSKQASLRAIDVVAQIPIGEQPDGHAPASLAITKIALARRRWTTTCDI